MPRARASGRPGGWIGTAALASFATLAVAVAASCSGRVGGPTAGPSPSASAPGSAPPATTLAPPSVVPTPSRARVVLIVMENHELSQIVGNACCPFINALARRGALFTDYTAVSHPSLPNYLAMTSGSTRGRVGTDETSPIVSAPNLFAQLSGAGIPWRAYEETMPAPCFRGELAGAPPGDYALKHDPAMMYRSVAETRLCRDVVPWRGVPDVLPRFSLIVPNECDDMHSCGPGVADAWLRRVVPRLLPRLGPDGRIVVTWDEGVTNAGGGGRVPAILVGPGVAPRRIGGHFDHYGLLAALETVFHLRRLGLARSARPLPLFAP